MQFFSPDPKIEIIKCSHSPVKGYSIHDSGGEILSTIHGLKAREVFTDVKSGNRIFLLWTTDMLPPMGYQETRMIHDNKTGKDMMQAVIKCNALKCGCPDFPEMTPLAVSGRFDSSVNAKYGWQFLVDKVQEECTDGFQVETYLLSDQFRGIFNSADARNIRDYTERSGADFFKIINGRNAKSFLKDLTQASELNIKQAVERIRRMTAERKVFARLRPLGFNYTDCCRLIKLYGPQADELLIEDPYRIGLQIGADFLSRDKLNYSMGKGAASPERFYAIGMEAARALEEKGHSVYKKDEFCWSLDETMRKSMYSDSIFPASEIIPFAQDDLVFLEAPQGSSVSRRKMFEAEQGIVEEILRIAQSAKGIKEPFTLDLIDYAANLSGVTYGNQQKQAFFMLQRRGFKILTGGPGTGKTTTINGLLAAYERMHPNHKIKCCAPTGRAAQRMSESTGREAITVHRLLDTRPDGNNELAYKVSSDPIDADLLVVDETSMLDIELCYHLLKAVKNGTTVLFVGDVDQLESVGPGCVLKDLLKAPTDLIERCMLTEIFRQGADSPIIVNSQLIKTGSSRLVQTNDFRIITTKTADEILPPAKDLIRNYYDPKNPFKTQILCPVRKGPAGIEAMNKTFQALLNGSSKAKLAYGNTIFKQYDKVIMTQNNYNLGYYNGDIGMILAVKNQGLVLSIRDETFRIDKDLIGHVDLSYSLTIHKSQGSEFENVIIILPRDQPNMLARNLIYTAVTRAKKRVWILEEEGALKQACLTDTSGYRHTMLGVYMSALAKGEDWRKIAA